MVEYKSTKDIKVPKRIVDQVIGQDAAVQIIKKAALQRRHVLLIGEPGTGKSMLGIALAELLPHEKLVDTLAFANPNDENQPLIRTVKAGQGREIALKSKLESANMFKNQNIIMFILLIIAMIAPWWVRAYYKSDVMFAAFFLGGMIFLASFVLFINLGQRMGGKKVQVPKVIVDNYNKKQAPFMDATGAHAGALLGDVLHDPFQSFFATNHLQIIKGNVNKSKSIQKIVDDILLTANEKLVRSDKNYESVHLKSNDLSVLGETQGSVSPVVVLSSNRYDYDGQMIKLTTTANKELIVTPEHKVAIWRNEKIEYVHAQNINEGDEVVAKSEDIVIDEQDIINTYDERQQKLAKSYYDYLEIRNLNPSWGYKRIATKLGVSYGRTRLWWEKNKSPVPVQTAKWLKEKGLLPLKTDNPHLPLIAKILGATFGDGGIFENLNGIFLSSKERNAVCEFRNDLESIFGLSSGENSGTTEGGEYGNLWCSQNTNRNIIRFFVAMGSPIGNKTKMELYIPGWILMNSGLEDEFYGSFLGGEKTLPIMQKNITSLSSIEVCLTGSYVQRKNRIDFLNNISNYLYKKGVSTAPICEGKTNNPNLRIFRLLVSKKYDNIMKFLTEIRINYCKYKVERLNRAVARWTLMKKTMYDKLISEGLGSESAMKKIRLTPNSLYLILNYFDEHSDIQKAST